MAKRVFFSFHYQDVIDFRANVVRSHWLTKPNREDAGYFDSSIWEAAKRQGDLALKRLINAGLNNTSSTCVLIGSQTYARPWVRYELLKSFVRGNQLLAVHINGIKGKDQLTRPNGPDPLAYLAVSFAPDGRSGSLQEYNGARWVTYERIDGTSRFAMNSTSSQRGGCFTLKELFRTYDWSHDDGYNNFASWLA